MILMPLTGMDAESDPYVFLLFRRLNAVQCKGDDLLIFLFTYD